MKKEKLLIAIITFFIISFYGTHATAACHASFTHAQPFGNVVTFSNTSTGITASTTCMWDFGDATTSTFFNAIHTFMNPGTYHVCLTITDTGGCNDVFCSNITVTGAYCDSLRLGTTVLNVFGCYGSTTGRITVNGTGGTPLYVYSDDTGTTWIPVNIFTNLAAGNYGVCIKDIPGCVACTNVEITQPSPMTIHTTITNSSCFTCADGQIIVSATGGNGAYYYSKNCGAVWSNLNVSTFSSLTAGTYCICVKDQNGCRVCDSAVVISSPTGMVAIGTNFSIHLSPNPFSTTTTLTLQSPVHGAFMNIYNVLGQEVGRVMIGDNNQIIIGRNGMTAGMYFYKIMEDKNTLLGVGKLFVE